MAKRFIICCKAYRAMGAGKINMKIRRFRAFAEKKDLQNVFEELQGKWEIYYVPVYSDAGEISYDNIMDIENLGINFHGSHHGNRQILVFVKSAECLWRTYRYKDADGQEIKRYSALDAGNSAFICFDFNGIYKDCAIFPTEISTMYYDNNTVKQLYDELKRIFRKQAVKIAGGCYICPGAYGHKEKYRFCTIDIKSPPEYDIKVE